MLHRRLASTIDLELRGRLEIGFGDSLPEAASHPIYQTNSLSWH